MSSFPRRAAVLAALLSASLVAACGGDSAPASAAAADPSAAAAPAAVSAPATVSAPAPPAGATPAGATPAVLASQQVVVYKTPTCGCCKAWVDHLRANGFDVVERDSADLAPVKAAHGVPGALESCHTAVVDGYVIEGHVPADLVAKLLAERPEVAGLAVPGMPAGSPGMEGPYKEAYDVLAFQKDGRTTVYARR